MSAFIPERYIPDIDQRLLAYRQLTKTRDLDEIKEFKLGLLDRYGTMPIEVSNLLFKIELKVLCIEAGIKKLDLMGKQLMLQFSEIHLKNPTSLVNMVVSNQNRFQLIPEHTLITKFKTGTTGSLVGKAKNILKEIIQHVNG
jgi:transcription-repair coupling factor (superfamily II helicase)